MTRILKPEQEFGRYVIKAELGRGGQAVVYRARQIGPDRDVALKVFDQVEDPRMAERFRREAVAAGRLKSPHIVTIYDAGDVDGVPFIAMELIEGPSLRQMLSADAGISPGRALAILDDVAQAIDATHSSGLIHRDIKPANVLLDANGRAWLSDFGIVQLAELPGMTARGDFLGTVEYASPEQAAGKPITAASDIYSFGAMAFELLAGRPPFVHQVASAVLVAHVNDAPPAAHAINPALPAEASQVLAHALSKAPEDRPHTATETVQGLRAAFMGASTQMPGAYPHAATVHENPRGVTQAGQTIAENAEPTALGMRYGPAAIPGEDAAAAAAAQTPRRRRRLPVIIGVIVVLIAGAVAAALIANHSSGTTSSAGAASVPTTSSPVATTPTRSTPASGSNQGLSLEKCGITYGADGNDGPALCPDGHPNALVAAQYDTSTSHLFSLSPDASPTQVEAAAAYDNAHDMGTLPITQTACEIAQAEKGWSFGINACDPSTWPISNPSTSTSTSASPVYSSYVNSDYGFSVDIPTGFTATSASSSGDGQTFSSPDGQVTVSAYGASASGSSLASDKASSLANLATGGQVTYQTIGADFYVISGYTAQGLIFYQRTDLAHGDFATLQMIYPTSMRNPYDGELIHMASSLQFD